MVRSLTKKARIQIQLVRDPPNMPELMAHAALAIGSAGSTSWELAFMGVPAILLVTADNQQGISESAAAAGAAVNLGWCEEDRLSAAIAKLDELMAQPAVLQKMSDCGRALIDGQGVRRIAEVLLHASRGVEAA